MKAAALQAFAAQGCSAAEIAAFLGMDLYRVRWLLRRGGCWPRRSDAARREARLCRLVAGVRA